MKKTRSKRDSTKRTSTPDAAADEMRPEYDFRGGVRGKYVKRLAGGSNVVVLDPDVAAAFPTPEAVNRTLRAVAEIARGQRPAKRPRRRTA